VALHKALLDDVTRFATAWISERRHAAGSGGDAGRRFAPKGGGFSARIELDPT
jgi:hypothetical protein